MCPKESGESNQAPSQDEWEASGGPEDTIEGGARPQVPTWYLPIPGSESLLQQRALGLCLILLWSRLTVFPFAQNNRTQVDHSQGGNVISFF